MPFRDRLSIVVGTVQQRVDLVEFHNSFTGVFDVER